jgi:sec-independent protein translocase protein TatC
MICAVAVGLTFAVGFWQNHALLKVLNRALPANNASQNHINGVVNDTASAAKDLALAGGNLRALSQLPGQSAQAQQAFAQAAQHLNSAAKALPQSVPKKLPITIGVGEPFTTTLTVSFYFALLFALPVILYQAYAFIIPALNPNEKRVAIPVMMAAPLLFLLGVFFAYEVVLPPAVRFLQGYNSGNFDILVQAKTYYTFEILTMLGIGVAFQLPIGLLALQRIGAINSRTLTRNWRYITVIIAVIAAAMPGADPVTTGLEMLPLVLLFVLSIVMLKIADRRAAARAAAELSVDDGLDLT